MLLPWPQRRKDFVAPKETGFKPGKLQQRNPTQQQTLLGSLSSFVSFFSKPHQVFSWRRSSSPIPHPTGSGPAVLGRQRDDATAASSVASAKLKHGPKTQPQPLSCSFQHPPGILTPSWHRFLPLWGSQGWPPSPASPPAPLRGQHPRRPKLPSPLLLSAPSVFEA